MKKRLKLHLEINISKFISHYWNPSQFVEIYYIVFVILFIFFNINFVGLAKGIIGK